MGYQLQPSSNAVSKWRPIQIHTPTPVHTPKVLVPNSSMSSVGKPSPALSMPTSFGVAKEDVGSPSQDQKPSIVKLDLTQSGHSKAVLRKELKKDVQMNAVFQEIHVDFYLLAITENLFIENSVCFNPVIRQLAHKSFTRLCVTPFDIVSTGTPTQHKHPPQRGLMSIWRIWAHGLANKGIFFPIWTSLGFSTNPKTHFVTP